MLDDPPPPTTSLLGSLGELSARWRAEFRSAMARRGFTWHLGAGSDVLAQLTPAGLAQTTLVERLGVSKQAVQQVLDHLEQAGVVRRETDAADKRAKRVMLTDLGLKDFAARSEVMAELEERVRERLGKKRFARLEKAVRKLARPPG